LTFLSSRLRVVACALLMVGFASVSAHAQHGPIFRFFNRNNPEVPDKEVFLETKIPLNRERLIGAAQHASVYTGGFEYAIHYSKRPWFHYLNPMSVGFDVMGALLFARVDSTFEFLPVAILREPLKLDSWGNDFSPGQKNHIFGVSVLPIGYRLTWFPNKPVRMFWDSRVGGILFTEKALSPTASMANFSFGSAVGTQFRLNSRMDFRLGAEFFHFSDGYFARSNPGMDQVGATFGVSYHIPRHQILPFPIARVPRDSAN
jgi:opacity protein-like surface antigen